MCDKILSQQICVITLYYNNILLLDLHKSSDFKVIAYNVNCEFAKVEYDHNMTMSLLAVTAGLHCCYS